MAAQSPIPNGLPHELAKQSLSDYYLEPGDRILIEPTSLDSKVRLIGDQKIQVDGSIDLSEFGRIRAAGLTVESAELAIEDRIQQLGGGRISINVQLVESNAAEFYVLGEVGSPGAYPLDGNETVLDAILRAGGLTSKASPCDMILVRPTDPCSCRVVLPVCYRQITQLGDVSTNYQLLPGDRIVVGARTFAEEIAFWKQSTECDRCCRSQCRERAPQSAIYRNRIPELGFSFPLPQMPKKAENEAPKKLHDTTPQPQDLSSDADMFLPRKSNRK
jgi:protein involved in polysaccharide export with SLBB domain